MAAEVLVGGQRYPGQLIAVSPEIVSNEVGSRIRFDGDMPPNLRQNQRLTTRVLLEERPDVLILPRGQFLESGAGRVAYVLEGGKLAHRRPITIGARSLSAVQVESGLEEGEAVVISSLDAFQGADTVLITN